MAIRYTQHEKLAKVQKESQAIGEFIEWMQSEKGYTVCELIQPKKSFIREYYAPVRFNIQEILGKFYGINLNKLEEEKRHMLTYIRGLNIEGK